MNFLLLSALLLNAPDVTVQTLDGDKVVGALVELRDGAVVLQTDKGPSTIALEKLMNLAPSRASATPKAPSTLVVRLIDGSLLAATSYRVQGVKAEVGLAGGASVELPTRAIHWVRFQNPAEPDGKLAGQWTEIVESKAAADLLVVRKQAAIDYLEGVLQDIDAETVKFELDKEVIPVKLAKVEGLVYYHAARDELPEPLCEVADVHGSRLTVKSLALAGDKLKVSTPGGVEFAWPLDSLSVIDFSGGKVQYLSDLNPTAVKYVPYFALNKDVPGLADFYQPARDVGLEQNPLKLDGKQYRKGLALHSQTLVEYRLPGKFRRFKAVVGIDDSVREAGHALVEIKGDGKSLWKAAVKGAAPAEVLDLNIEGVKRLEIFVDFGDDLDVADHVDLCEARVLK